MSSKPSSKDDRNDIISRFLRTRDQIGNGGVWVVVFLVIALFAKSDESWVAGWPIVGSLFTHLPLICVLLAALGVPIMLRHMARTNKRQPVQLIAWNGWDSSELYGSKGLPAILLYEGGFHTFPRLKYQAQISKKATEFDLLVTDMLYLRQYAKEHLLKDMTIAFPAILNAIDFTTLARCASAAGGYPEAKLGFPIEFGFSELLVNPAAFRRHKLNDRLAAYHSYTSIDTMPISYSDFSLESLLNDLTTKIGIWSWYIPALLHLIPLCDKSANIHLDHIETRTEDQIRPIIELLAQAISNDRIVLIDSLADLNVEVRNGGLGIILGAGSWALPWSTSTSDFVPIVPREGVHCWLNCVAAFQNCVNDNVAPIIENWFSHECQRLLPTHGIYRSLPTVSSALNEVVNDPNHPSRHTIELLFNRQLTPNWDKVKYRRKPRAYFHWQHQWDQLIRENEAIAAKSQ